MDESLRIWLEYPDGSEHEFEIIGSFAVEEKEYMALLPADAENQDVYLIGFHPGPNDEILFDPIEDDREYDSVSEVFTELFNSEPAQEYDLTPMYEQEDALLDAVMEEEEYCYEDAEGNLFVYGPLGEIIYLDENGDYIIEESESEDNGS